MWPCISKTKIQNPCLFRAVRFFVFFFSVGWTLFLCCHGMLLVTTAATDVDAGSNKFFLTRSLLAQAWKWPWRNVCLFDLNCEFFETWNIFSRFTNPNTRTQQNRTKKAIVFTFFCCVNIVQPIHFSLALFYVSLHSHFKWYGMYYSWLQRHIYFLHYVAFFEHYWEKHFSFPTSVARFYLLTLIVVGCFFASTLTLVLRWLWNGFYFRKYNTNSHVQLADSGRHFQTKLRISFTTKNKTFV